MSAERFSVLIGLHERRLAEARRRIGILESAYRDCSEAIDQLEQEQLQAAAGIDYLLYQQYLDFCSHLQSKIEGLQGKKVEIEQKIEESWEIFRSIRRELKTFEQLQERQDEELTRQQKRKEQREIIDQSLLRWLEASS